MNNNKSNKKNSVKQSAQKAASSNSKSKYVHDSACLSGEAQCKKELEEFLKDVEKSHSKGYVPGYNQTDPNNSKKISRKMIEFEKNRMKILMEMEKMSDLACTLYGYSPRFSPSSDPSNYSHLNPTDTNLGGAAITDKDKRRRAEERKKAKKEGKFPIEANAEVNSGVTIGAGVDLGNRTRESLDKMLDGETGLSENERKIKSSILEKLGDKCGKKGAEALQSITGENEQPELTSEEEDFLNRRAIDEAWNQTRNSYGKEEFDKLPCGAKKALVSNAYHGNTKGKSKWLRSIKDGKFREAADQMEFAENRKNFKARRKKEADMLRSCEGSSSGKEAK